MPVNAREAAFRALDAYRKRGARPDMILKGCELDSRDMALASNIVSGVLQNSRLLDWRIEKFGGRDPETLQPEVRDILRLTAYQLLFLDRVPAHAAVSQGVELAKRHAPRATGLVNAVLRRISETTGEPFDIQCESEITRLGLLYSHPDTLVAELYDRFGGPECERILAANNAPAPLAAQVNTLRTTPSELRRELESSGVETALCPLSPNILYISNTGPVEELDAFKKGHFYIQDPAARLAVTALDLKPGDKVLDLCAAPGGKSFAAAMDTGDSGEIRAFDIHEKKLNLIRRGVERLGFKSIYASAQDGRAHDSALDMWADAVIADVPCSGIGVIRRKPEIRYKTPGELSRLPEIQLAILKNAVRYVRPGGTLLYSTCTIRKAENEDVAGAFLEENPDFDLRPFTLPEPFGASGGMMTILPGTADTDGFFICLMKRKM